MALSFPEILDKDFTADNNELGRQYIDAAIESYISYTESRLHIKILYESYNGVKNTKVHEYLTKTYGQESRTPFIRYRLGRTKMDLLSGEFLFMGFDAEVETTNRESIDEKYDKIIKEIGAAKLKPVVEDMRQQGVPLFNGVELPSDDNVEHIIEKNIKSDNESVMQHIINSKVVTENLLIKFDSNFTDTKITSECFGKIEINADGVDTYRTINPKYAIFQEFEDDPFLEQTPYFGELRFMAIHELLGWPDMNFSKEEIDLINSWNISPGDFYVKNKNFYSYNSSNILPVFFLEWKANESEHYKIEYPKGSDVPYRSRVSHEWVNKNADKINKDVEAGKYTIETTYREVLWEGVRILDTIYKRIRKKPFTMASRNGGLKYRVLFDYVGLLYGTKDGIRISLQEMLHELEMNYDITMFQLRRELNRIKGSALSYDRSMLPRKMTYEKMMFKLVEDGIIDFSSTDDPVVGNMSNTQIANISNALKPIDLGASQSIPLLIQLKQDIERTVDRLTGINENREGLSKASSTASGISGSVEASRSITYPLFHYFNHYCTIVLTKLCEKAKLNPIYTDENGTNLALSTKEKKFIKMSNTLGRDDYSVNITNGRKNKDIKDRMRALYEPALNAKTIRVSDIMKAEMQDTFVDFVKVIDKANTEITKLQQKEQQMKMQHDQQMQQGEQQFEAADKKDNQQFSKEFQAQKDDAKKDIMRMKLGTDLGKHDDNLQHDTQMEQMKQQHERQMNGQGNENNQQ